MIHRFKCNNYKNLSNDELNFKKINILIGPNNSGKTNLLEAVSFFSDVVKYGANNALIKRSLSNIPNKFSSQKNVTFEMIFQYSSAFDYNLKYKASVGFFEDDSYKFIDEVLSNEKPRSASYIRPFTYFTCQSSGGGISNGHCSVTDEINQHSSVRLNMQDRETFFRQMDTALEQLSKGKERDEFLDDVNPVIKQVGAYLDGWFHYNMARIPIKDVIKSSKAVQSDEYLELDGSNFQNLMRLYNDTNVIEKIEYFLKNENIIPNLDRIKTPTDESGNTTTNFIIGGKPFKLSELSDGTIRLLLLLLITKFQKNTPTIFIDEPESNLHPAWLSKVYKLVSESESQIFISTHAADLLDKFTNDFMSDDVNIFVVEDGNIKLLNEYRDIISKRIEEGWELGDLYRVGDTIIGGWPW